MNGHKSRRHVGPCHMSRLQAGRPRGKAGPVEYLTQGKTHERVHIVLVLTSRLYSGRGDQASGRPCRG